MFIYSHRQFRLKVSNEINIRDKAGKTLGLLYMLPVSFIFPGSFNLVKFSCFTLTKVNVLLSVLSYVYIHVSLMSQTYRTYLVIEKYNYL